MSVFKRDAFITLAPDWICEVLSPGTAILDRKLKLKVYEREQVQHAWLIDPTLKSLEVFRLDGANWTVVDTHSGADVIRAEPVRAVISARRETIRR